MIDTLQGAESFEIKGPQLEVFGRAETALPAPLKKKSSAALVALALAVVSVFGIGGAKLKGKYDGVKKLYAAATEHGNSITNDLASAADYAANVIRLSENILGSDNSEVTAAQQALAAYNNAKDAEPSVTYEAYTALCATVDSAYQQAVGAAGANAEDLKTQNSQFTSTQNIIKREVVEYNEAAAAYNTTAQGFPARLIAVLWGAGKAEPFA